MINISEKLKDIMIIARKKGLVLSTAESCTGGLIAKYLTDLSGSSEIYDSSFITYLISIYYFTNLNYQYSLVFIILSYISYNKFLNDTNDINDKLLIELLFFTFTFLFLLLIINNKKINLSNSIIIIYIHSNCVSNTK